MLEEGLKIIEKASMLLESISKDSGVNPSQFFDALDANGILDEEERALLIQAATSVEVSLFSLSLENDTVH